MTARAAIRWILEQEVWEWPCLNPSDACVLHDDLDGCVQYLLDRIEGQP